MVKQFFCTVILSASFLFSTGVIALNKATADEVKKAPPCYANKCYSIIADCPKNCLGRSLDDMSFDSIGKSNLDTIFSGCVFLRQKISQNEYAAWLDCDTDGKADVIFKLTFLDCEENTCFKCKGTYIRKIGGEVVRTCKLTGYVTDCISGPQDKL